MKYLIKKTVINGDHIVKVDYEPANSGIDSESGEKYTSRSSCVITLSSVSLEEDTGYEGSILGVASVSDYIKLRDTDADRFWEVYSSDAYQVVTA